MAQAAVPTPKVVQRSGTILVIDDMQFCRELVAEALRAQGYNAIGAVNGVDALSKLEKQSVDMVICDIEMPQMSGLEFMKVLRSKSRWQNLPVILLTGGIDRDRVLEAGRLRASEYMLKTNFSLDKLLDRVNKRMEAPVNAGTPGAPTTAKAAPAPAKAAPAQAKTSPARATAPAKATASAKPQSGRLATTSAPATAAAPKPAPSAPAAPRITRIVSRDISKTFFPKLLEREQVVAAIAECGKSAKTLPGVAAEVIAMCSATQPNFADIAGVIRQDPVLAGKVLWMANTAAMAPGKGKVFGIEEAARNIGGEALRKLVSGIGTLQKFGKTAGDGVNLLRLWEHSLATGAIMDRIVPKSFEPSPGAAYLIGLCHDLAEILLREHLPEQFVAAMDFANQEGLSLRQLFSKVSGISLAEVTQLLMTAMKIPAHVLSPICEYAAWEDGSAERVTNPLAVALRVANFHSNALQLTSSPRDAFIAPFSQAECRAACITATPIKSADIRSESVMTVSMMAKDPSVEAELNELLKPATKPKILYTRHASFAAQDPLEEALKLMGELTVRDALGTRQEMDKFDGFVIATPRRENGGFSIDMIERWRQGRPQNPPKVLLFIDDPTPAGAPQGEIQIMTLPVVLADLANAVSTLT